MKKEPIRTVAQRMPAKGTFEKTGRRKIVCRFEDALFAQILTSATASSISFAEQVRRFCRGGLRPSV